MSNSCSLMKKLSKSSASSSCSQASCVAKVNTVRVSALRNLSCKNFQAFDPSPMPSSPIQSSLISMRFVASRISAKWHNTLFRFSLPLQLPSHMHPSAPCDSSFHHSLPHWIFVQADWVAPLFQVVICTFPSSTSLPHIL